MLSTPNLGAMRLICILKMRVCAGKAIDSIFGGTFFDWFCVEMLCVKVPRLFTFSFRRNPQLLLAMLNTDSRDIIDVRKSGLSCLILSALEVIMLIQHL